MEISGQLRTGLVILLIAALFASQTAVIASPATTTSEDDRVVTNTLADASADTHTTNNTDAVELSTDTGSDTEIELGEEVEFEAEPVGVPDNATVERYIWNFGDTTTRESYFSNGSIKYTNSTITHTYVRSGTYTVSATAVVADGTQYNGTTNLTVEPTFGDVPTLGEGISTTTNSVYQLNLTAGQSIGLQAFGSDVDTTEVLLYDPNGSVIQSEDVSDYGPFFGATTQQNGTYYVGVNPSSELIPGGIRTSVTPVVRDPDKSEPNQDQSTSTPLEPNTSMTKLTLTENDTVDWYAITVSGPATINVSGEVTVFHRFQGDTGLQIYNSDGKPIGEVNREFPDLRAENPKPYNESAIAGGGLNKPEQRAQVDEAGTYYVRVKGIGRTVPGSVDGLTEYNLTVTTNRTEEAEYLLSNLDPAEATVTAGDDPIDVSADVENVGDEGGDQDIELTVTNETTHDVVYSDTESDVALDSEDSTTVTFGDVPAGDLDLGTYTHEVSSEDGSVAGSLTVEEDSDADDGDDGDADDGDDGDGEFTLDEIAQAKYDRDFAELSTETAGEVQAIYNRQPFPEGTEPADIRTRDEIANDRYGHDFDDVSRETTIEIQNDYDAQFEENS
ncbi:MAG: PKD domain-containing protein [Halorubrum sp.]|uniref:PKD domain-containing protein n=1 Tax=Halorubrum sp. TaxID=1879286 RepID=UPI003970EEA7